MSVPSSVRFKIIGQLFGFLFSSPQTNLQSSQCQWFILSVETGHRVCLWTTWICSRTEIIKRPGQIRHPHKYISVLSREGDIDLFPHKSEHTNSFFLSCIHTHREIQKNRNSSNFFSFFILKHRNAGANVFWLAKSGQYECQVFSTNKETIFS